MLNRFEYAGKNDKKRQNYRFWEEGNDAQEIFLNDYFNQKLKTIHENPLKAEIVYRPEDYKIVLLLIGRERKGYLKLQLFEFKSLADYKSL